MEAKVIFTFDNGRAALAAIESAPDDFAPRRQLLAHVRYAMVEAIASGTAEDTDQWRALWNESAVWTVRNFRGQDPVLWQAILPPSPEPLRAVGDIARVIPIPPSKELLKAWDERLAEPNATIADMEAAAYFFQYVDTDRSEALFLELAAREPEKAYRLRWIPAFYAGLARAADDPANRAMWAKASLAAFDRIAASPKIELGDDELRNLAVAARRTGDRDRALRAAADLLAAQRGVMGLAFRGHFANVVFGLYELDDGDVASATKRLRLAGHALSFPKNSHFAPDISLAEALFNVGETKVVEQFMQQVADNNELSTNDRKLLKKSLRDRVFPGIAFAETI